MWTSKSRLNELSYRASSTVQSHYYYTKGLKSEDYEGKIGTYVRNVSPDRKGIKLLDGNKTLSINNDNLVGIKIGGMGTIIASNDLSSVPIGTIYVRSCFSIVLTSQNKACVIHIPNNIVNDLLVMERNIKSEEIINSIFRILNTNFQGKSLWRHAYIMGGIRNITLRELAKSHVKRAYQVSLDLKDFSNIKSAQEIVDITSRYNQQIRTDFPESDLEELISKVENDESIKAMKLIYSQQNLLPRKLQKIVEKNIKCEVEIKSEYTNKICPIESDKSLSIFVVEDEKLIIKEESNNTGEKANIQINNNKTLLFDLDNNKIELEYNEMRNKFKIFPSNRTTYINC